MPATTTTTATKLKLRLDFLNIECHLSLPRRRRRRPETTTFRHDHHQRTNAGEPKLPIPFRGIHSPLCDPVLPSSSESGNNNQLPTDEDDRAIEEVDLKHNNNYTVFCGTFCCRTRSSKPRCGIRRRIKRTITNGKN